VHKQFRRFDIVVGSLFAVLVIIGVVTVSTSSKPTVNSSRITRATAAAAPTAVRSGTLAPPTTAAPPMAVRPTTVAPAIAHMTTPPAGAQGTPDKAAPPPATHPAPPAKPAGPPPKPAPLPTTAAPPAPAGCTPKTDAGNCYEPGEFCRAADHGDNGVAGDGKAIRCEDNDGWRWEPV
jgi:hypothetical protein